MAYLRSKSSENRVKASVGAKTRSGRRSFCVKIFTQFSKKDCSTSYNMWYNETIETQEEVTIMKIIVTGKNIAISEKIQDAIDKIRKAG